MARNFSLSGLLRLRSLQEKQAAAQLASANQKVRDRYTEHELMREELAGSETSPVDSDTLLALAASRAATRAGLGDLEALLAAEQQEAIRAVQAHQAARAGVKSLEKLELRHQLQVRADDLAKEQVILDDLAGTASRQERG